jgi:hypothetical protein
MTNNFIVAKLCDNDYGRTLAEGSLLVMSNYALANAVDFFMYS